MFFESLRLALAVSRCRLLEYDIVAKPSHSFELRAQGPAAKLTKATMKTGILTDLKWHNYTYIKNIV